MVLICFKRYKSTVEEINKIGGSVFAHDHYAHGESGLSEVEPKQFHHSSVI